MTPHEELTAAGAKLDALVAEATPGPWEVGNRYGVGGVNDKFGPGRCTYCHHGPPVWSGRADINGTTMDAHEHRFDELTYEDLSVVGTPPGMPHATVVVGADDYAANLAVHDATYIAAMGPDVGRALAVLLHQLGEARRRCGDIRSALGERGVEIVIPGYRAALDLARAILGREDT